MIIFIQSVFQLVDRLNQSFYSASLLYLHIIVSRQSFAVHEHLEGKQLGSLIRGGRD